MNLSNQEKTRQRCEKLQLRLDDIIVSKWSQIRLEMNGIWGKYIKCITSSRQQILATSNTKGSFQKEANEITRLRQIWIKGQEKSMHQASDEELILIPWVTQKGTTHYPLL